MDFALNNLAMCFQCVNAFGVLLLLCVCFCFVSMNRVSIGMCSFGVCCMRVCACFCALKSDIRSDFFIVLNCVNVTMCFFGRVQMCVCVYLFLSHTNTNDIQ